MVAQHNCNSYWFTEHALPMLLLSSIPAKKMINAACNGATPA